MSDEPTPEVRGPIPGPLEARARGFWRGVFSEVDGTPSSSRVLGATFGILALVWVSLIVWAHIHSHYEPMLPDLGGLAVFISTPYGINKGSDAIVKAVSIFKTNVTDNEHR